MSPVLGEPGMDIGSITLGGVYYVNASAAPDGDGGSPDTAFQTLKAALDKSGDGDTIMIASGEYKGANNTGLSINKNLSFEKYGDGEAIIDAQEQNGIFTVTSATINITGLTFKNGKRTGNTISGGAIYIENALSDSIINATFIDNTAVGGNNLGGAIYFKSNVDNVKLYGEFINNTADLTQNSYGGAIAFSGTVSNSVINATFIDNSANLYGGALYSEGNTFSNVEIYGEFKNNKATHQTNSLGGAISFRGATSNSVINATFIDNTAYTGAAIYFRGTSGVPNPITNLDKTGKFINNTGEYVIDVYSAGTGNEIHDAVFLNNAADKIINIGSGNVAANDNWFGNNATNYDVTPADVGIDLDNWLFLNATADPNEIKLGKSSTIAFKLYNKNSPDVAYDASKMNIELDLAQTLGELDKSTALIGEEISYTAKDGGDASVTGKFETASYTISLKNKLPASIYVNVSVDSSGDGSEAAPFKTLKEALDVTEDGDTIMIAAGTYTGTNNTELNIDNNISFEKYGEGEAIFDAENQRRIWNVNAGTININGLTFKNGKSLYGGAISFNNPLSNSNINAAFINNTASNGGAVLFYKQLTNVNITGNFTNNTAYQYHGGAIYITESSDNVNIYGEFINNEAPTFGGAIFCYNSLSNSNITAAFINNIANSGGAIFCRGNFSNSCMDATFINNTAADDGGAIYFSIATVDITGRFINNTGNNVIYIKSSNLINNVLHDSIFINNNVSQIFETYSSSGNPINANYNWFGNNATNYNPKPNIGLSEVTNWLFLNATAEPSEVVINENSKITFKWYVYGYGQTS